MIIKDFVGKLLPENHNLHIMYPWGANSRTVTLQPKIALGKQPIVQQLDDWIQQRLPGNSVIGYIITRGKSIHIYMDTDYAYNFARWNPDLVGKINHDGGRNER